MSPKPIKLLLIEDNPGDARLIREMLSEIPHTKFVLEQAGSLNEAVGRLSSAEDIDVVLLDLSLPDSSGLETFRRLQETLPQFPVIVLTGLADETVGVNALQAGAQDYLLNGKVDGDLLSRSIRYAIERQRLLRELRQLLVTDELTGLYNRRGLKTFGTELLKIGRRAGNNVFLIYCDLDKMKWINDTLGHLEGDKALKDLAEVMKRTFRETDLVARIGGDEFAILGILSMDVPLETLTERLRVQMDAHNDSRGGVYKLSVSVGSVCLPISPLLGIDELLQAADEMMYDQKRQKG